MSLLGISCICYIINYVQCIHVFVYIILTSGILPGRFSSIKKKERVSKKRDDLFSCGLKYCNLIWVMHV